MQNSKIIHYTLAFLWVYQGLIPKVLFINKDEIAIWMWFGLSHDLAEIAGRFSGLCEIIFGVCFLLTQSKYIHYLSITALVGLFALVALVLPHTLAQAFNPVVMNTAMVALSALWISINK